MLEAAAYTTSAMWNCIPGSLTNLNWEGNDIIVSFQMVVPKEVENNFQFNKVEAEIKSEVSDN